VVPRLACDASLRRSPLTISRVYHGAAARTHIAWHVLGNSHPKRSRLSHSWSMPERNSGNGETTLDAKP
jgi:hypothetical protein